jgi:hypothetical protein
VEGFGLRGKRLTWRHAIRIRGFREWVAAGVHGDQPYAVATSIIKRASPKGLKVLVRRFQRHIPFDPQYRVVAGSGLHNGKPHGYLGRGVLDLGDRHAHAIIDVPWNALKVGFGKLRAKLDPWRRWAHKHLGAELLAIRNPHPTGPGDKAIVEAALRVNRGLYNQLRASGEFDVLPDGVLARRGRKKKATNIFIVPK